MMRGLLLCLLVANVAVFAWTQGWLEPVVHPPALGDREPERLLQQVHPDRIRLLSAEEATQAASTPESSAAATQGASAPAAGDGPMLSSSPASAAAATASRPTAPSVAASASPKASAASPASRRR